MTRDALAPIPGRRVLGVFARQPMPGQVKTRLAAATSPVWAAAAAEAFLRDLLKRLTAIDAIHILAYTPASAAGYFAGLAGDRFALWPQGEGDLGRRMQGFVSGQLDAGAERVVLVGADSPTLPVAFIEETFARLDEADVVLGPATDGGYYLLGCARRVPPLFEGIAWGSERVLLESVGRLGAAWRLALLPPWYDVDTLSDWWALRGHLAALRAAGQDPGVPHTERLGDP
jgi:rSAM/selenodomain-associated transferase 1